MIIEADKLDIEGLNAWATKINAEGYFICYDKINKRVTVGFFGPSTTYKTKSDFLQWHQNHSNNGNDSIILDSVEVDPNE